MPLTAAFASSSSSSSLPQADQYNKLFNGNIPISYLDSLSALCLSDPFDILDLQSLPSLMSPDPSLKDSFDDDEEMDGYEIFAAPQGQSRLNPTLISQQQYQQYQFQQLQLQLQHYQLHPNQALQPMQPLSAAPDTSAHENEPKPKTPLQILRPNHPMVLQRTLSMPSLHQYFADPHSHNQQQRQQQSQPHHESSQPLTANFTPSINQQSIASTVYAPSTEFSPAYRVPGATRFTPLSEALVDPLDHYLSSFQIQSSILENTIPALDQDIDLMMLSNLILSPTTEQDEASVYSEITSNSMFSSPPSWTSSSTSRDCSPKLSPASIGLQEPKSASSSLFVAPPPCSSSSIASAPASTFSPTTVTTPSPKRRKRVRPPTAKKPKKIRPTTFPCAEIGCGKSFSRAYNLTSHMKTHSKERPFVCGSCSLGFARRHDLERHIRLHTGEKPYSCPICEAGFMRNDALLRHQKLCGVAGSSFAPIMDRHYLGQNVIAMERENHSRGGILSS
ncbi:hypothetical protein FBU30_005541 [Linnemannia zychae]|nr:hypothetical protein FBU30_005541 [Linnemannia zychae]